MAVYARLVALLVAAICLSATTQTGVWRGPADLACVGEGHSRLPERRQDAIVQASVDADGIAVDLPAQPPTVAPADSLPVCAAERPAPVVAFAQWRGPVMSRGPPRT